MDRKQMLVILAGHATQALMTTNPLKIFGKNGATGEIDAAYEEMYNTAIATVAYNVAAKNLETIDMIEAATKEGRGSTHTFNAEKAKAWLHAQPAHGESALQHS